MASTSVAVTAEAKTSTKVEFMQSWMIFAAESKNKEASHCSILTNATKIVLDSKSWVSEKWADPGFCVRIQDLPHTHFFDTHLF